MSDNEEAIKAFTEIDDAAWSQLVALNNDVQSYKGSWGETKGGTKDENGVIEMPYTDKHPLISKFVQFMYENELVIVFDWAEWDDGRAWYRSEDPDKYSRLDIETALKLLTAVIRNDRFHDGALVSNFESGEFPKIINALVSLKGR